jgi:hypothetical protein
MTEAELRALVRDAVARHLGGGELRSSAASLVPQVPAGHPSHYQYLTIVNVGESCVIEPSVECNHCGYCRSHGH